MAGKKKTQKKAKATKEVAAENLQEEIEEVAAAPVEENDSDAVEEKPAPKKRGRPAKAQKTTDDASTAPKKRGRPTKVVDKEESEDDAEDDMATKASPKKRGRQASTKPKEEEHEISEEEDDDVALAEDDDDFESNKASKKKAGGRQTKKKETNGSEEKEEEETLPSKKRGRQAKKPKKEADNGAEDDEEEEDEEPPKPSKSRGKGAAAKRGANSKAAPSKNVTKEFSIVLEHCKSCGVFKRHALAIQAALEEAYPDNLTVVINPEKPRRGSFECTFYNKSGASAVLWSGVDKGPPRKLKFPENPKVIVDLLKQELNY